MCTWLGYLERMDLMAVLHALQSSHAKLALSVR
jgi:hypothetical protein